MTDRTIHALNVSQKATINKTPDANIDRVLWRLRHTANRLKLVRPHTSRMLRPSNDPLRKLLPEAGWGVLVGERKEIPVLTHQPHHRVWCTLECPILDRMQVEQMSRHDGQVLPVPDIGVETVERVEVANHVRLGSVEQDASTDDDRVTPA